MRFTIIATLSALSAVLAQSSGSLIINTPILVTCQPYAVTWGGGQAPYYVSVVPGGQGTAAAIETLGSQPTSSTSYTWVVNLAAGTSVTLKIVDSQGVTALSGQATVQAGTSTSCVGQPLSDGAGGASSSAGSSAASSAAATTSAAAATTTSAAAATTTSAAAATTTTAAAATTTTAAAATTTAAGTAPAATTTRPASGAGKTVVGGLLGVVGAVVLAIGA